MKTDFSALLSQIQSCKDQWDQTAPQITPQDNLQGFGVSVSDITKAFEEVVTLLNAANDREVDGVAWCVHKGNFDSIPNAMTQFFASYWNSPAQLSASSTQISSWLWSLKTSLLQISPIHPESARLSPDFEQHMSGRIQDALGWFDRAEELKSEILKIEESARKTLETITSQAADSGAVVQTIQGLLATVQGEEREAGTAKTNAISSAAAANAEAATVSRLVQDLTAERHRTPRKALRELHRFQAGSARLEGWRNHQVRHRAGAVCGGLDCLAGSLRPRREVGQAQEGQRRPCPSRS
jgi:hypothetical protein